jgi:hypothetical protein
MEKLYMKEYEDLTNDEKSEILKQVDELPEQPGDSLDMFVRSFDDLSKSWANAIKEFDNIYSDTFKADESSELESLDNITRKSKIQSFL